MTRYTHTIVGGGLHGGMLALALLDRDPAARVALVERAPRLGGNHTWSFHAGDLSPAAMRFVAPLVVHEWPRYEVRFPAFTRVLDAPYRSCTSERLHDVVTDAFERAPNAQLLTGIDARAVGPRAVVLADGTRLVADAVFDARGAVASDHGGTGFQLFVGLEFELARDHGFAHPILMDATVPQYDGYRFVYVLPMGPRRVLVEDTYFGDRPALDRDTLRRRVEAYAAAAGLEVAGVAREEAGVLPMPWRAAPVTPDDGVHRIGYRGGWFHPATAYSLGCGARVAAALADTAPDRVGDRLRALARHHGRQTGYARVLNNMLFRFFAPGDRRHVFERFYRLPAPTIQRFYGLQMTVADRARILIGRPPRGFALSRPLRARS